MKNIFENTYRFGVETFLIMYLNNYQLVLNSDLEDYTRNQDLFDEENPCNIYFILRKPKVTVDPNSIKIDKKIVRFNLHKQVKENISVVNMCCEFPKNYHFKIATYPLVGDCVFFTFNDSSCNWRNCFCNDKRS